ncbi:hemin uptake protein HemP [Antarctobacter heliothermus]|nr:hemin uptake protein HemP [Antarctobacter heliothermus]
MRLSIAAQSTQAAAPDPLPLYDARTLTDGGGLARIRLADQVYTLRITRAGKLILTK